jgi:hypothetical protein
MQKCPEHKDLRQDITEIKTDIALIKQCLMGNSGKKDGVVDKVNKHDMWFYIVYGMITVIGFLLAHGGLK